MKKYRKGCTGVKAISMGRMQSLALFTRVMVKRLRMYFANTLRPMQSHVAYLVAIATCTFTPRPIWPEDEDRIYRVFGENGEPGSMALTMTSMRVNTFLQGSPVRRPAMRAQAKRLQARQVLLGDHAPWKYSSPPYDAHM